MAVPDERWIMRPFAEFPHGAWLIYSQGIQRRVATQVQSGVQSKKSLRASNFGGERGAVLRLVSPANELFLEIVDMGILEFIDHFDPQSAVGKMLEDC